MALTANMVTIDCADPSALAGFWTQALEYAVVFDHEGSYVLLRGTGGLTLGLQKVPEARHGKNRVHLDLSAPDLAARSAEVDRLIGLGASVLSTSSIPGYGWRVLADPEGNVFCVGSDE